MTPTNTPDTQTVQLHLPATVADQLREKATSAGVPLEVYLEHLAERDAVGEDESDPIAEAVRRLTSRTPEQIMADREEVLRTARRGRPLPEGKTLFDVVEGTWPGDETDEEIRAALEKLS